MSLSDRILKARTDARLTQQELADSIGVTKGAVSHWEAGKSYPRQEIMKRIAQETGVSKEWLLVGAQYNNHDHTSDLLSQNVNDGGIETASSNLYQELLDKALSSNADITIIMRLTEAKERKEKQKAQTIFNFAVSGLCQEILNIYKSKDDIEYNCTNLKGIFNTIVHLLPKYKLSYRWRVENENDKIKIICILFHECGHAEENSLSFELGGLTTEPHSYPQKIEEVLTVLQYYILNLAIGLPALLNHGDR